MIIEKEKKQGLRFCDPVFFVPSEAVVVVSVFWTILVSLLPSVHLMAFPFADLNAHLIRDHFMFPTVKTQRLPVQMHCAITSWTMWRNHG